MFLLIPMKDKLSNLSLIAIDSALLSFVATVPLYIYIISPFLETQKAREEQIQLASKMSCLGEMAAGVAHEINNPLAVISGKIDLLSSMIKKQNIDYQKAELHTQTIQNMIQRIASIVKGLKRFSRDETAEPMQKCHLNQIMSDSMVLFHSRIKNSGIQFKYSDFSKELLKEVYVNCHPTQISQVLVNLLTNSADAIEKNEIKWIELQTEFENDHVLLKIIDSGRGIPIEIKNKIFNPFFTTKEVGKGTGLGLSISSSIIKNHKGELYIDENNPNTCFVLKLPLSGRTQTML